MKANKGITLVELVIAVGIIGLLLVGVFSTTIFSYNNFKIQNEKRNINSDRREVMDYLIRQIRKSNEVHLVDNTLILDSITYKLEDGIIYKDDQMVFQDIDELYIDKEDQVIEIKIIIKDSRNREHEISSKINIR